MKVLFAACGLWLLSSGCSQSDTPGASPLRPLNDVGDALPDAGAFWFDPDRDGLCDDSELALGTNPDEADTDRDGLPDLVELVSGFDPVRLEHPAPDQVAYLPGGRSASVDFTVRFTVEGDGQGLSGWFTPVGDPYRDGDDAQSFFTGSIALTADPVDASRRIDKEASRFEGVLGKSRLSFSLRFEHGDRAPGSCTRAYPFRYTIKADDGEPWDSRDLLLVVGAEGAAGGDDPGYCIFDGCE